MKNNNSVIFKANQNGIIIFLDNDTSFKDIKNILQKKINDSKKFFDNSKTTITFKGKNLNESEEIELLNIISNSTDIDISFVSCEKKFINKNIMKNLITNISSIKNMNLNDKTLFYKSSVRSGQIIQYKGNVVVIGSINPGAKVIANDNIIVLGSIKGIVHAGYKGNNNSFIASLNLISTQIRISKFITCISKKNSTLYPSLAYINKNKIYIEPLV